MKKILTLLLGVSLLTGCNITKYDNDFKLNIDNLINKEHNLHNMNGTGYKYYLPRGVRLQNSSDYNKILYSNGQLYYLYLDIIGYYYKTKINYEINKEAYFYKKIVSNDSEGYIEINKINNKYLIKMMYNYAKIEAYVSKEDIDKVITDFIYILTSVSYIDSIIETLVGDNILNFNEEKIDILTPRKPEKNYIDYNIDVYEEPADEIMDNDKIKIIDEAYFW